MDTGNTLAALGTGILEGMAADFLGGVLRDQLDRLDDTIDDLVLNTRVLTCTRISSLFWRKGHSPSVFSRMVTMSTSSYLVLWPSTDLHGRTLAKRENVLRSIKFIEG